MRSVIPATVGCCGAAVAKRIGVAARSAARERLDFSVGRNSRHGDLLALRASCRGGGHLELLGPVVVHDPPNGMIRSGERVSWPRFLHEMRANLRRSRRRRTGSQFAFKPLGGLSRNVSFCDGSQAIRCTASPGLMGGRIIPFFKLIGCFPGRSSGCLGTKPTLFPTRTKSGRGG